MSALEVFLDDTPGEVRGVVAREGRFERLILQREIDPPAHRLGAVSVGRIARVEGAFRAAFVDLGGDGPMGFLPLTKGRMFAEGEAVEVEVTAEPREAKGPVLTLLGAGQGAPRLLAPGPTVEETLAALAPGCTPTTGAHAIRAGQEAEEEALGDRHLFPAFALDLAVERTRALIAVDIDYAHLPGRDPRKGRERANREGLRQAARLIALKSWGGLVAVDLVGTALDPKVVADMAKAAFGADVTLGPVSRFAVLQLALPWRARPVEDLLLDGRGRRTLATRALDATRALRLALLSDTASPRIRIRCAPDVVEAAGPLVARLGPRAALQADPGLPPDQTLVERD
ncbi:hypothetical protein BZG35_12140 [Brevundimonas sp. LM2]|uniref:hypothetical protein n=1 Tax=Brevundimonas sp. LM2 TaxID=1938605 RepID=UPI000983F720|nr:hypothetical protein [Brevundimonas sp. LM2]AQR62310.1 hypothetical protein BZG35_12140 [Brevundimonas sp. LM2]